MGPAPEWVTLEGFIPGVPLILPVVITTLDGRTFRTEKAYRAVVERRKKKFEKFVFERLGLPKDASPSAIIEAVKFTMVRLEEELKQGFPGRPLL